MRSSAPSSVCPSEPSTSILSRRTGTIDGKKLLDADDGAEVVVELERTASDENCGCARNVHPMTSSRRESGALCRRQHVNDTH